MRGSRAVQSLLHGSLSRAGRFLLSARFSAAFALACVAGFAVGCRNAPEAARARSLDTVDVAAQPDAAATLEADGVAPPRVDGESVAGQSVAGALPADFPRDVPLPVSSSLVDFGPRSVTLEVQRALGAARDGYLARLRAAGFRAGDDGAWQKGARRLRVAFADASGATRVTIEIL